MLAHPDLPGKRETPHKVPLVAGGQWLSVLLLSENLRKGRWMSTAGATGPGYSEQRLL